MTQGRIRPWPLWILPAMTALAYAVSFAIVAVQHGTWRLLGVVIHEGGAYTLLETILYASHFLGHAPVHTILAIYFVGTAWRLSGSATVPVPRRAAFWLAVSLGGFLLASVALSLSLFGAEDTLAYVLQQRQRVRDDTPGGSWMLHLPSTLAMFLFIPVFVGIARVLSGRPLAWRSRGRGWQAASVVITILLTAIIAPDVDSVIAAFSDPRYLGHAVREIATFPVTYFPVPLFVLLCIEPPGPEGTAVPRAVARRLAILAAGFLALFAYQCWVPLSAGLGSITQKPAFAGPDGLGVSYLLASHFFEHVLDSIYFGLLVLALHGRLAFPPPV